MPGDRYPRRWKRIRKTILDRDGWICRWCGIDLRSPNVTATVDHVWPIELGGDDDEANLVAACKPCNSSRSDRPGPPKRTRVRTADSGHAIYLGGGGSRSLPPEVGTPGASTGRQEWRLEPGGSR